MQIKGKSMSVSPVTGLIAIICLLNITSCSAKRGAADDRTVSRSRDIFAMDTYMNLKAYGSSADEALDAASERIYGLDKILSVTNESSDVCRLNSSGGLSVALSEDTVFLLNAAKKYGGMTGGALDITLYPVLREWGFTTGEYRIPSAERLAELLCNVDYTKVEISGTSAALPADFQVDLGALAKGYTSNEAARILKENGVDSAIMNLGGNVQAVGSKPDGSDWRVAVRDPYAPDTDMCVVDIADKAVITSGNYERYFTGDDGRSYWHILDPSDGYPADNGLVSVTIIGDDGLMCDALSTAFFVAGKDIAADIWRETGGFDMILVTDEAEILYTEGISDSFENISSMPAEVIRR